MDLPNEMAALVPPPNDIQQSYRTRDPVPFPSTSLRMFIAATTPWWLAHDAFRSAGPVREPNASKMRPLLPWRMSPAAKTFSKPFTRRLLSTAR